MFFLSIVGKLTWEASDDPKNPTEVFHGISCEPIQKLGNYSLSGDEAHNFTDRQKFIASPRQWPEESFPVGSDADDVGDHRPPRSTTGPQASTSQGPQGAAAAAPPPLDPVREQARKEYHKELKQWHFSLVQAGKREGLDLIADYQQTRLDNILVGLSGKDRECKICKKTYSNTQHLRNHIRLKHLKKTPYQCTVCSKYYSDAGSLRNHMAHHDQDAEKFKCGQCNKEFIKKSKYLAHCQAHKGKQYKCEFCKKKEFAWIQGLQEHVKNCKANPANVGKDPKPFKCRLCGKGYTTNRSLLRHLKDVHDGANPDG